MLCARCFQADEIIQSSTIYLKVMKWSGINQLDVPAVGLTDGLVHSLYDKYKATRTETSSNRMG
jgi:exopolyphosphatase / guanosine-5'-triphosphate,3'-diphosphate pyrophosphatase